MGKYTIHKAVETDNLLKSSRLAASLKADPHHVVRNFLRQLKHDGCNTVVIWDPHGFLGEGTVNAQGLGVYSRTGERVLSMDHLLVDLLQMPPGVYLGEAWKPGLDFNEISGIYRRKKAKDGAPLLDLQVFDGLTLGEWAAGASPAPFHQRWSRTCAWMQGKPVCRHMFRNVPVRSLKDAWVTAEGALQLAVQYQDLGGFDGLIYRDPMGTWTAGDEGRSGEIIKIKPRIRLTLRVTGYLEGKGKHLGRIGTLLVSYKGKEQGAGTGLKDYQRDITCFPMTWGGKLVEIECLGVTPDGYLREPVLLGIRDDVVEADA